MALLTRALPLLLLASAVGCELPSTPLRYSEASYSVHAVLKAGEAEARVLVTRFDPRTGEAAPAAHSEVTLASDTDTVRLLPARPDVRCTVPSEAASAAACYAATLPRPIAEGERWRLLVRLPDGSVASGETRVIAAPVIIAPGAGARIEVENRGEPRVHAPGGGVAATVARVRFHLQTDRMRGDWAVRTTALEAFAADTTLADVACEPALGFFTGASDRGMPPFTILDEVTWGTYSVRCWRGTTVVPWDSIRARVDVTAFDVAYSRYNRQVQFHPATRPAHASVGIEGVFGVFASISGSDRHVLLVARP